jgi:hypothetical protein
MKSIKFDMNALRPFALTALLLCSAGLLPAAPPVDGPQREFTKNINREFGTTARGVTALYNKYGKVNVNTWSRNSVKIDITIVVNAGDQRVADRAFDRIKVNFVNTAGYVKSETVVEEMDRLPRATCQDFQINYDVWIPEGNQLDLKNKYGNSYVANLNAMLNADIKHGDLRTEAIAGDLRISLAHGKAHILRVGNVYGQVNDGELSLPEARDVQLDTWSSKLKIDQAGAVRITSRYDDITFGRLDDLRLQTKYTNVQLENARSTLLTGQYTDFKFTNVSEKVDADLLYGNLVVKALGRNFSEVNVVGEHTTVRVAVERGAAFRFDAEGNNSELRTPVHATLRSPRAVTTTSSGHASAAGYVGDARARGLVKVRLTYGDLILK